MPLFGHKEPAPAVQPTTTTSSTTSPARTGFFRRRSSSLSPPRTSTTTPPKRHSTLLHRNPEDHSITTARNSLVQAEAAEREADRALFAAKAAVKAAREQLKMLEREAAEEARLAKIKQSQAKAMSKRGKGLGRHEHV